MTRGVGSRQIAIEWSAISQGQSRERRHAFHSRRCSNLRVQPAYLQQRLPGRHRSRLASNLPQERVQLLRGRGDPDSSYIRAVDRDASTHT